MWGHQEKQLKLATGPQASLLLSVHPCACPAGKAGEEGQAHTACCSEGPHADRGDSTKSPTKCL